MNTFAQAIATPQATTTTNGMVALDKTGNELTDLFFNIGSARNALDTVKVQFARAFGVDQLITAKMLFWVRDVRGGAGERQTFRTLLNELEQLQQSVVVKNIALIPEFGRWDDLLVLKSTACRQAAFAHIALTLRNQTDGWQLCSKWMPRKGADAVALRNYMNLSPKAYRKMLVHGTQVVETAMCSGEWNKINYEHVPSIAAKQYQQAFGRHDAMGYSQYKQKLVKGEAKINASSIFPHDVIMGIRHGDQTVAQAQWDSLPNYLGDDAILPMVDVSGSMGCKAGGSNATCLDVAVALGLYIANKQQGAFHKTFLTFSGEPTLQVLRSDTIVGQMKEMERAAWDMNTNIEKAFQVILRTAKNGRVPQDQMPKVLLIMSDMQFDRCTKEPNSTALGIFQDMYKEAGYEVPKVVFWNLNASYGNAPVEFKEGGTALISGFSPAIMKSILACQEITPYDVMMTTLGSSRYERVVV